MDDMFRCQRYCRRVRGITSNYGPTGAMGTGNGATLAQRAGFAFPVPMRIAPTFDYSGLVGYNGNSIFAVTAATLYAGTDAATVDFALAGTPGTAQAWAILFDNLGTGLNYFAFTAEL